MTHITIHHTEEEWEGDYGVDGGINLFVGGYGVLINNHLEVLRKLVCFK